jgi:hypothetical protein
MIISKRFAKDQSLNSQMSTKNAILETLIPLVFPFKLFLIIISSHSNIDARYFIVPLKDRCSFLYRPTQR